MAELVVSAGRKWAFISRQFNSMRSEHTIKNHYKKLVREILNTKEFDTDHNTEVDRHLFDALKRKQARLFLKRQVKEEEK